MDPKFVTATEARKFLRDKDEVLGVVEYGVAKAYPIDVLGFRSVEIVYDVASDSASAFYENGGHANGIVLYWFAWQAFHPDTDCFRKM